RCSKSRIFDRTPAISAKFGKQFCSSLGSAQILSAFVTTSLHPLGKGSHDGNQKPKIVGRASLTKYCINRIKNFYVPPPYYIVIANQYCYSITNDMIF
ncbi:hypothetical protein O0K44_11225, partial [Staphylococcus pseudintermedius]|nr:hypothetical protein [Staphylococcus pseudintermedius]